MKAIYSIEVFRGKDRQWYWRCRHCNGNILATSEAYKNKRDAVKIGAHLRAALLA